VEFLQRLEYFMRGVKSRSEIILCLK